MSQTPAMNEHATVQASKAYSVHALLEVVDVEEVPDCSQLRDPGNRVTRELAAVQ